MRYESPLVSFRSDAFCDDTWLTALLDQMPVGVGVFDPAGHLLHANSHFTTSGASGDRAAHDPPSLAPSCTVGAEWFGRFAEHSSSAIVVANAATGRIDYFSPAAQRIWPDGRPLRTVAEWEASIHPDDRILAIDRHELVREGRQQRFEYRIVDCHGDTMRHVRESSFPMPSPNGAMNLIGSIVEDVSPEVHIYLVQAASAIDPAIWRELNQTPQRVTTFASQDELLHVADALNPGCVILDLRVAVMPDAELMALLHLRPAELEMILIGPEGTGSETVIGALKAGAADYLVAPIEDGILAAAVRRACEGYCPTRPQDEAVRLLNLKLAALPRREREVFMGLVGGGTNKTIARTLSLSPRTVEVHRAHLMQRLNVRTLTDLLHLARDAGIKAPPSERL